MRIQQKVVSLLKAIREQNRILRATAEHYGVFVPAPCLETEYCTVLLRSGSGPTGHEFVRIGLVSNVFCYSLLLLKGDYSPSLVGVSHVIQMGATDEAIDFFVSLISPDYLSALYGWLTQVYRFVRSVVSRVRNEGYLRHERLGIATGWKARLRRLLRNFRISRPWGAS